MKESDKLKLILIDLDGTLLNDEKKIGSKDIDSLHKLGNLGIIRAVATGRTFHHSLQVLDDSVPIDYLIFSSGAGIYDWKTKKMLFKSKITKSEVAEIAEKLIELQMNFAIHHEIPHNHKYHYHRAFSDNSDFDFRNSNNKYKLKLNNAKELPAATQVLIISSNIEDVEQVRQNFPNKKVIRASSPIDGKSIWIEIFNTEVSKAKGGKFLCDKLNISEEKTLSIGNDYNDLDLLNWTKYSYVTENSPKELKYSYTNCCSNNNHPLTDVLRIFDFM